MLLCWVHIYYNCYILFLDCREGNGKPLQYSCLENSMDGGAWWAAVHEVAKSRTRLSDFTFTFHFHTMEKAMETHSSVLAWRIPGTAEPGGLPSMGSHRVRHDWSDLAAVLGLILWSLCSVLCLLSWSLFQSLFYLIWVMLLLLSFGPHLQEISFSSPSVSICMWPSVWSGSLVDSIRRGLTFVCIRPVFVFWLEHLNYLHLR